MPPKSDLIASLNSQLSSLDNLTSQSKQRSQAFLRNFGSSSASLSGPPKLLDSPSDSSPPQFSLTTDDIPSPSSYPPTPTNPPSTSVQTVLRSPPKLLSSKHSTRSQPPAPSELPIPTPRPIPVHKISASEVPQFDSTPKDPPTPLMLLHEHKFPGSSLGNESDLLFDISSIAPSGSSEYCSQCYLISERVDMISFIYKLRNSHLSEKQCLRAISAALSDNKILILWRSEIKNDLEMFVSAVLSVVSRS
ncbi:hypothetical protein RCL1_005379 [Eukaryota sp. TZLM3-RCL]